MSDRMIFNSGLRTARRIQHHNSGHTELHFTAWQVKGKKDGIKEQFSSDSAREPLIGLLIN